MAIGDVRGRRWLPSVGVAALVALTILDVVLIRLAFDHVDRPTPTAVDPFPRAVAGPGEPEPSAAPEPSDPAAPSVPRGPLLLALAPDGTVLRAATGDCADGIDPQVAVAQPGSSTFRVLPVAADLAAVLTVRADGRDDLAMVGAGAGCEVSAYEGSAGRRTWEAGPARDEWYLDVTQDPAAVHAPGGPVDIPCTPVALSTLDSVRVLCDGGAIVGTGDGGETWAALGRLRDATAMAFQGPGRGLALAVADDCPVAALLTENGGAAWETVSCLDGESGRAVALRGDAAVAVVDVALWRSADGGETWDRSGG